LFLLGLVGCGPVSAKIILADADTDADADVDTDTDADVDSDADADTDTDIEPAATHRWNGERAFFFENGCEDKVTEIGDEMTADSDPDTQAALASCPGCQELYAIDVNPTSLCDGEVTVWGSTMRGVAYGADNTFTLYVVLYQQAQGWSSVEMTSGESEGRTLSFEYDQVRGDNSTTQIVGWAELIPVD